ncbi:MAG: hypothetical protein V3T20_03900 [Gemmatimonadota bacterium]
MRWLRRFAGSAILALAFAVAPLAAQDGHQHEGMWGSLGAGVGFNLTENSEGERLTGLTVFGRGGYALAQKWLVGADLIGWHSSESDIDLTRGLVAGTVLFYPSMNGGFYFKGSIGGAFSRVSAGVASDGTTWGFGSALGLGYDVRLGSSVYLTLAADWLFQDVSINTQSDNQLGMLTLGLTFF